MNTSTRALLSVSALGVAVPGLRKQSAQILDDITFDLRPGEIIAILGANGAGKSTLIAALSGEIANHAGTIILDRRPLASWSLEALAARRALNATEPAAPFALSVADYVALGRPFDPTNANDVGAALAETHATQWAKRDVATLSSGEQTRVQIARSLYQLADAPGCIWLLDEPCAHLDLAQRQFVLALIARVAKTRQWSVVFSTHDPAEALQIADLALLLREGSTVAVGAAAEVINSLHLSACYGVSVTRGEAFVTPTQQIEPSKE